MLLRSAVIGLAIVTLASCSDRAGGASGDNPGSAVREPANLPADPAGAVRLRGDGIEVTGSLGTTLAFGSPRETVEAELAAALGEARAVGTNTECGAGPIAFTDYPGGLTLNFQDGALVGWSLSDGDSDGDGAQIATAEGIALDSSKAELAAAYELEMMTDSTLGEEFTTPAGISGFLAGEGAQAEVESLHAGTNCFFR